jgi:hypothetical protein
MEGEIAVGSLLNRFSQMRPAVPSGARLAAGHPHAWTLSTYLCD